MSRRLWLRSALGFVMFVMLLVATLISSGTAFASTVPAAPSNASATATSSSSIRVAWNDNSNNESGFRVYNGVTSVYVGANTTTYTWGGLAGGTYMCFSISAYNAAGYSAGTPYACTTTPTIPAAPSNASATATSSSSIRVAWNDNSNNESGFRVYNGVTSVYVGANTTTYTWGGLAGGTYMCFSISAYNAAGYSAGTPYACTKTPTSTIPAAPSNASAYAINSSSISVEWFDNSNNESGFRVYNGVTSVYVGANTTTYTWGGLAGGTYMCFSISAYNAAGYSAGTPWACTTTPTSSTREQRAIAWARSVLGNAYTNGDLGDTNHPWNGWCDNFVGHAYGLRSSGYATAVAHYNDLYNRGLIHTGTAPFGALVFFGPAAVNGYNGHVMLSEGNGYYISTGPVIQEVTISWPGAPYLGWAYANPEWPGR